MSAAPAQHVSWLEDTPQLDLSHPKLRITAHKLTQSRQTLHERAAAIHDFVRRMPFSAVPGAHELKASEILARGAGDCHAKGVLFIALCRAAGLPARLLLVEVRTRFLAGMLDGAPPTIAHVVGQVKVDGKWVSTDGYVIDPLMFARAKQSLRNRGMDSGWGIVCDAKGSWDGRSNCLQQFHPADVVATLGVYADLDDFRRRHLEPRRGWLYALKYFLGSLLVNRRVSRFRDSRPVLGGQRAV